MLSVGTKLMDTSMGPQPYQVVKITELAGISVYEIASPTGYLFTMPVDTVHKYIKKRIIQLVEDEYDWINI